MDGYNNEGLVGRLWGEGQLTVTRRCYDLYQLHGVVVRRHLLHEVVAGLEDFVILAGASWMHCFIFLIGNMNAPLLG